MTGSWATNRHVIMLLLAMAVAAYHMLKLEQRRTVRDMHVDEEFERAIALLRSHFVHHDGNYHVTIAQRQSPSTSSVQMLSSNAFHRLVLVVNRGYPVPRIGAVVYLIPQWDVFDVDILFVIPEAELVVDAACVSKPLKNPSRAPTSKSHKSSFPPKRHPKHQPSMCLTFLVYDTEAMTAAASLLEQHQLAHVVRRDL